MCLCSLRVHVNTMKVNDTGLSRMSTIFWLLISISSLHRAFISLSSLLKGSSSLPWLISSQAHRSQAFPAQCSLCSHKDPRNPAACPQLIFPVATLLTQPPMGRGCKCKAENRPLCVHPPPRPSTQSSCRNADHSGGLKPLPTISIKGSPRLLIKQHHTPPTPHTTGVFVPRCSLSIHLCPSFFLSVALSL